MRSFTTRHEGELEIIVATSEPKDRQYIGGIIRERVNGFMRIRPINGAEVLVPCQGSTQH